MELIYAFDKDSEFSKRLDEAAEAIGDLTIPLILMAKSWYRGNKSIFMLKGRGRYQDLSPKYKKWKERILGSAYPILRLSGTLEAAITDPQDHGAINLIVNKKTLILGVSGAVVPYAIFHQSQTLPRNKMPYRPFLFVGVEQIAPSDIQNERLKSWNKILSGYMIQSFGKMKA